MLYTYYIALLQTETKTKHLVLVTESFLTKFTCVVSSEYQFRQTVVSYMIYSICIYNVYDYCRRFAYRIQEPINPM